MKYDIEFARNQVSHLDQFRISRALSGATEEFQHVFQLITLLLHCNTPHLAGYVADAPFGIVDFSLTDYQRQFLNKDCASIPVDDIMPAIERTDCAINGVYIMGSIASIAQTSSSDLDIWVCHRTDLASTELEKLQQKITALQAWAKGLFVDMNLFLMDENRFRDQRYCDHITQENSGSAQYMLLLDEFYRSAIRLAGKPLLWLHLMVDDETLYEREVEQLIQHHEIDRDQWVDFGGLGKFSAKEYFGASLWLLYKGINAPFKAVIKILLLEAYSYEYPNTRLIASDFKFHLLMDHTEHYHFDPYLEMLDRVTEYLTYLKDFNRLDFVRRCIYLKSTEDLWYHHGTSWRFNLLSELVKKWGWDEKTLEELKQRPFWKIRQVKEEYNALVRVLMLSYRNLTQFARKHNVNASIMPQDVSILTRKIYTVFEELPGKVTLINPQISTNLSEPDLIFVEVTKPNLHKKVGWYLLNQSPDIEGFAQIRHTEYNSNLAKLTAWAYFNGLLTPTTRVHLYSKNVQWGVLNDFIADLAHTFSVQVPLPTQQELQHQCKIRQLLVAVNLTCDPTAHFELNNNNIRLRDLFSFGSHRKSLVGSVDLVYRNLWNEIRTLHFDGSNAILQAMKALSNKIHRGAMSPNAVHVRCYSENHRVALTEVVSILINKCLNVPMGNAQASKGQNSLRVVTKNWLFFFDHLQDIAHHSSKPEMTENFAYSQGQNVVDNPPHFKRATIKQSNNYVTYPAQLDAFATEGFLQFFFEDVEDGSFNVYILDEQNHIEIYRHCDGDKEQKINEINHIYTTAGKNGDNPYGIVQRDFNYPQFYQLQQSENQIQIVPFQHKL